VPLAKDPPDETLTATLPPRRTWPVMLAVPLLDVTWLPAIWTGIL